MCICRARICEPFKVPWNRFPAWRTGTTTLFVVPARQTTLHRRAESIPRNRFLGSLKVYKYGLCFRRGFVVECNYVIKRFKTRLFRGVIDTTDLKKKNLEITVRQYPTVLYLAQQFFSKFGNSAKLSIKELTLLRKKANPVFSLGN
jgi:hypothetical protein